MLNKYLRLMDGDLIQVILGSNETHAIENKNELDENLIPFWPTADPEILNKIPKITNKDTIKFLFIAINSEKDIVPYKEIIEKYFQSWQKSIVPLIKNKKISKERQEWYAEKLGLDKLNFEGANECLVF